MNKAFRNVGIYLLKILALAVLYHLGARLGLMMAYVQPNTSPVWPSTGLAIAALLLFGINLWPGVLIGVVGGSIINNVPVALALGMGVGNTLEALVIAYGLKHLVDFKIGLSRVQDVLYLLGFSLLGTMVSATFGTMSLMLTGLGPWEFFVTIWITWWVGNLLGALVVAPVLLVWSSKPKIKRNWRSYLEGSILLLLLSLFSWYVFSSTPQDGITHRALLYFIFPITLWAALRFEQRGATTAIFLVSGIAIWGTAQGIGPYSLESLNNSLVLLQTFTGVVSLTMLILAAVSIERRKAAEALQSRLHDLSNLNHASKTFLGFYEASDIYRTICELAVTQFNVDAAWLDLRGVKKKPVGVYGIEQNEIHRINRFYDQTELTAESNSVITKTINLGNNNNQLFHHYATLPISFGGQSLGTLNVASKVGGFFNQERLPLFESFANLCAVAIQNAWLVKEVQTSNKQLHALSQHLISSQEKERLHLSREIHDESGQLLSALSVKLGLLERDTKHVEKLDEHIIDIKQTANLIQKNLHDLAMNLRPSSLDHLGLITALEQYSEDFTRQYNIDVKYEAVGFQNQRLTEEIETALFRIVQESLTNVVLHAAATSIDILICLRDKNIVAVIEDDGIGFVPTSPTLDGHLGILGMRERIEMLNGKFTIESSYGKGTTVLVEVPLDD